MNLQRVQVALGEAIEQLEHYIIEPAERGERPDLEVLLKVTYALAQAAGSYRSVTESTFDVAIAEVRKELHEAIAAAETRRVAGEHPGVPAPDVN